MAKGVSSWRECAFYCHNAVTSSHALNAMSQNKIIAEMYSSDYCANLLV